MSRITSAEFAQWCLCQAFQASKVPQFVLLWVNDGHSTLTPNNIVNDASTNSQSPSFVVAKEDGTFPELVLVETNDWTVEQFLEAQSGRLAGQREASDGDGHEITRSESNSGIGKTPIRLLVVSTVSAFGTVFVHALQTKDVPVGDIITNCRRHTAESRSDNNEQSGVHSCAFNVELKRLEYAHTFTCQFQLKDSVFKLSDCQHALQESNEKAALTGNVKQLVHLKRQIFELVQKRICASILENRGVMTPTLQGIGVDLQRRIFSFLNIKELCKMDCICKRFRPVINSYELWDQLNKRLEHDTRNQRFRSLHAGKRMRIPSWWCQPRKDCATQLINRNQEEYFNVVDYPYGNIFGATRPPEFLGPFPQTEPIYGPLDVPGQRPGFPHLHNPVNPGGFPGFGNPLGGRGRSRGGRSGENPFGFGDGGGGFI